MKTYLRHLVCAGVLGLSLSVTGAEVAAEASGEGYRPPRIIERAKLEFPRRLLGAGVTSGEVRLFLEIDADGKLNDHLIVAYTHYEFANEVSQVVGRWRFQPAMIDGRAIAATLALTVRFEVSGVNVVERRLPDDRPTATHTFMFRARELNELDRVPRPLFSVAPPNPAGVGESALTGRAVVEFYIDEKGHVRMPVVVSADDERLGWAAVAAIASWEFEIPMRGGYPVLTRASQVFVFRPQESSTSGGSDESS